MQPSRNDVPGARALALAAALVLVTLVVYWPVVGSDFVNLDDDRYVTANPHVQRGLSLAGLRWALSSGEASLWLPLTWLSHMADCQLYGLAPAGHHVTNLLLHAANAALLLAVLVRVTGSLWSSAAVAALFALHPLRVESVAWVAERKDVLSALFWLLTLFAYAHYVERPGASRLGLVALCFAAGLMAKPMLVTLPFVLLLLDYWPLGRLARARLPALIGEKLPLAAMAAAVSVVTLLVAERGGATVGWRPLPLAARIANALVAYAMYLTKTVWPSGLAAFYPPPAGWSGGEVGASAAVLGLLSALAIVSARRQPFLLVGWLWFLGTLVPVIGIVQAGDQVLADRFTYVPHIGLFIALVWGGNHLLRGFEAVRPAAVAGMTVTLLTLAALSRRQVAYWHDSITLFTHAIEATTGNWLAHNNLGYALAEQGRTEEAARHFRTALESNPGYPEALNNLGTLLARQGLTEEAAGYFSQALRLRPRYTDARSNLGAALAAQGKTDEAMAEFQQLLALDPSNAQAHAAVGSLLYRQHRWEEALRHLTEALRLRPDLADARFHLAAIYWQQGRYAEAAEQRAALARLRPDLASRLPTP
ncbi:MAG: tetratricopeptide repeat protein [Deltaproteobacteria bacterium]|nr:MAG: tetratricopeptide repeat protein [Deltaproteobacteria bacterium]